MSGRTSSSCPACMPDEALNSIPASQTRVVIARSIRVTTRITLSPPTTSIKYPFQISMPVHHPMQVGGLAQPKHRYIDSCLPLCRRTEVLDRFGLPNASIDESLPLTHRLIFRRPMPRLYAQSRISSYKTHSFLATARKIRASNDIGVWSESDQ